MEFRSRTYFRLDEELYNKLLPVSYSGFPSPAEDFLERRIDMNALLIRNPKSTFFMKVQGNSHDSLIKDGDIIIIDCSLTPVSGDYVVGVLEGEFVIRQFFKKNHRVFIMNVETEEMIQKDDFEVWGVITYVIHATRK